MVPCRYRTRHQLSNLVRWLRGKPLRSLEEYVGSRLRPETRPMPWPKTPRVEHIGRRLWAGFSRTALAELNNITHSAAPNRVRAWAAWELARWHASNDEYTAALQSLQQIWRIEPEQRLLKQRFLMEVDLLLRLGRHAEAQQLIDLRAEQADCDTDLYLLAANVLIDLPADGVVSSADKRRLELINLALTHNGLHPIHKIDPQRPLSIDNVAADDAPFVSADTKISVIVPVYNADTTIAFALNGLRKQTWRNLEILVIDDASTDQTGKKIAELAEQDKRIRLIRHPTNAGAYAARNTGLAHASGDYITVHDSDDWSHPQKIETQIRFIIENGVDCTVSHWVRTSRSLRFNGAWPRGTRLIEWNLSSFMLPRKRLTELGGWDSVRVGGDIELVRRVETHNRRPIPQVQPHAPLSFALDESTSLTRRGETHVRTLYFGLRREYRRGYTRWHARHSAGGLRINPAGPRKFPAPAVLIGNGGSFRTYHLVVVGDFSLRRKELDPALETIGAALELGYRVGVFHWPRYQNSLEDRMDDRLVTLIDNFRIDMLVPGEHAHTACLLCVDADALEHQIDDVPRLAFDRIFVATQPDRVGNGVNVAAARRHLRERFGQEGEWLRLSGPKAFEPGGLMRKLSSEGRNTVCSSQD